MGKIYLLSNKHYDDVQNLEVFKVEFIKPDINFQIFDALIFTSKNAIYSLESFDVFWKNIPSYAIAENTANILKKVNANLCFTGNNSTGDAFAKELVPLLKNKKVLYVKALKTVSNLTNTLKTNDVDIYETVVYKTMCNRNLKISIEKNSTFIFTSPSSIECFFKNYDWNESYKAICIGKTTANYLPSYIEAKVSSITSIKECIKLAKSNF